MNKNSWKPKSSPFRKYKKDRYEKIISTASFIRQIGEDQLLREKSKVVDIKKIYSDEYQSKINYLKRCMFKYRKLAGVGRGITGVQIGIFERISVIYMPEIKGKLLIIINPKITKVSKKHLVYPEICMSANPIIAPVVRPAWIEFEYCDENGKVQKWITKDNTKEGRIYNRVFQHEIDHMDGIINIDRVESKKLIMESDPKFYEKAKFEEV